MSGRQTGVSRRTWVLIALVFVLSAGFGGVPASASLPLGSVNAPPGWTLAFADEFDRPGVDSTKWTTHFWWGRTNAGAQEMEYYADDAFEFASGLIRLRADRRSMGGFAYTSGLLASNDKFVQRYGYFEIRCRMPAGVGFWPAFWLLPDRATGIIWPPEIDVVEFLGNDTNIAYMNLHYANAQTAHGQLGPPPFVGPDFTAGFHTFAIDWAPDRLVWYVDGLERARTTANVPSIPMYVVANLAVGGIWPGPPTAATPFPGYYDVDYIRVYQRIDPAAPAPPAGSPSSFPSRTYRVFLPFAAQGGPWR